MSEDYLSDEFDSDETEEEKLPPKIFNKREKVLLLYWQTIK